MGAVGYGGQIYFQVGEWKIKIPKNHLHLLKKNDTMFCVNKQIYRYMDTYRYT